MKDLKQIELNLNSLRDSFNAKMDNLENEIKMIEKSERHYLPNFTITISDSYCTYKYPLNISRMHSISRIAEKIYEAFGIPEENGKLIK